MRHMYAIWRDFELHKLASVAFKGAGLTVAFDGSEDELIVKEAKEVWDGRTACGKYANMRAKLKDELNFLKERVHRGELPWCRESLGSLVMPYPREQGVRCSPRKARRPRRTHRALR